MKIDIHSKGAFFYALCSETKVVHSIFVIKSNNEITDSDHLIQKGKIKFKLKIAMNLFSTYAIQAMKQGYALNLV